MFDRSKIFRKAWVMAKALAAIGGKPARAFIGAELRNAWRAAKAAVAFRRNPVASAPSRAIARVMIRHACAPYTRYGAAVSYGCR